MGYYKNKMIEEQERGWSSLGGKCVCADCFSDYALAEFVQENANEMHCDYCGRTTKKEPIAVAIDDVMSEINDGIRSEWNHPDDEGVSYESAEGGYQGKVVDTWDLFYNEIENPFNNEDLCRDVIDSFHSQGMMWCQKHFYSSLPQDILRFGWEEFVRKIKYDTRYLFMIDLKKGDEYHGYEEIQPHEFLDNLAQVIDDTHLVTQLKKGTRIWRARVHERGETPRTALDLGPLPRDKVDLSKSNRMSPAGIPMFYGAFDKETAIKETHDDAIGKPVKITVGEFITARDLTVLDLSALPEIPSLFDSPQRLNRPGIIFLHSFIHDLSKQIERDGREHIEYVPTQVVTEYFRIKYQHPSFGKVRGILYPSAQSTGGKCCVLFFKSEDCCDISSGWSSLMKKYNEEVPQYWLGLDKKSIEVFDSPG